MPDHRGDMGISRSTIMLTAVLAVLAAGLLVGLSQWSAHLAQTPNGEKQATRARGPDLSDATEGVADGEAAQNAETTATDDASPSTDEPSPSNDEQTASDQASEPPETSEPSEPSELSDAAERAPSAEPAQPDPTLGDPNAPVTIIEFAEFYCPYCAQFMWERFPKLEANYIETGEVNYVFRNLTVHGMASIKAAVAGECAHDQDAFWAYSHRLFERVFPDRDPASSQHLDVADLKSIGAELGLDTEAFNRCLANFESVASQCQSEYEACQSESSDADACDAAFVDCLEDDPKFSAIMADRESLSALIHELPPEDQQRAERIGTPTFFINGRLLIGAQPFNEFERIIEEELERASSSP